MSDSGIEAESSSAPVAKKAKITKPPQQPPARKPVIQMHFGQGVFLKRLCKVLATVLTEINVYFTSNGLLMRSMDSSRVALVYLNISAACDPDYICTRSLTLGLVLGSLSKVMDSVGAKDSVVLEFYDEQPDELQIIVTSDGGATVMHFGLKLLDLETEALGDIDLGSLATVKMVSTKLDRILGTVQKMGDNVNIKAAKDGLVFCSQGDNILGTVKIQCDARGPDAGEDYLNMELIQNTQGQFSLRYLLLFSKAHILADKVTLILRGVDVPLCLQYEIDETIQLEFHLAPKLSDADFENSSGQ